MLTMKWRCIDKSEMRDSCGKSSHIVAIKTRRVWGSSSTCAWTMTNTRHARDGWITYGSFPYPDSIMRWQNMGWTSPCKTQCDFNCPILFATCFCSVEMLCLWQNSQFLGSSQCGSEKWQCHLLRFYWMFVPVAAARSLDKGSQGKTITGCFFQVAIPRSPSVVQLP